MATKQIEFHPTPDNDMLFAYTCNHFYIEISRLIPTIFHEDLDVFFVLAATINASIHNEMRSQIRTKTYTSDHDKIKLSYNYIKLLQLANITGLPRTTVRRKIEKLIDMGYIEHADGMGYRIRKGSVSQSPTMRKIINTQLKLSTQFINSLLERNLITIVKSASAISKDEQKPTRIR